MSCAYERFLKLAYGTKSPALPPLDALEERLFRHLALAEHLGQAPSVRRLMALRQFGAPATIHTRVKSMRHKGWVRLAATDDTRRREVVLTVAAHRELRRLSNCIVKALAG
jgi:DNA-binding MarR family transcriptional regulator